MRATFSNTTAVPVLALLLNALAWGVAWWPFRQLQSLGLHPLWATACIYGLAASVIGLWRPQALSQVVRLPSLWGILIASGLTNSAFNWAVSIGDVVRMVLLFYLMPLWSLLLARRLLGEAVTAGACALCWRWSGPPACWPVLRQLQRAYRPVLPALPMPWPCWPALLLP